MAMKKFAYFVVGLILATAIGVYASKVVDYPELAEAPASGDWFMLVDVSDTTDSPEGSTKKIQAQYVGGGTGDVTGPASSTDHALARFHLATGKIIQNSVIIVDDSGNVSGMGTLSAGAGGFTIDPDGDVVGKSFTASKQSGVAGASLLYEANSTDTNGTGWKGPASVSADTYYQFSNDAPAAADGIMAFAVKSGENSAQSWLYLDDTKGDGDTGYLWSADKIYDQLALKQNTLTNPVTSDGATTVENQIPQFTATNNQLKDSLGLVTTIGSPGSDTNVPTEQAVDEGLDTKEPLLKDTDRDIWQCVAISVAAMIADGTNASDPASEQINGGPHVWFSTVSDAAGTLDFGIPMPENWDGGNIYVEMVAGSNQSSPSGTVEFEVQAMARGNDDLINSTWLTTVNCQFADNIDTQYDVVIAESAVIACSGAGGDMLYVRLTRDNDDGTNDTSTQEVEVWGARVYYQIDDLDERD